MQPSESIKPLRAVARILTAEGRPQQALADMEKEPLEYEDG